MSRWSPKPAKDLPEGLILFDGVCVFCARWVRLVIERDVERRFSFASVQSPYGRSAAALSGIDPEAPQTNAVVAGGELLFKSDAALAVIGALPGYGWTRVFRALPKTFRDWAYDRVANNRYAIFGKSDACFLPAPADRPRFLDDAPPPEAG